MLIKSRKHEYKSCQPKQKMRRKLHRKAFERINESKWEHLVNLCESIILETEVYIINEAELYLLLKVQIT